MGRLNALWEAVHTLAEVREIPDPPQWPEGNLVFEGRAETVLAEMKAGGYQPRLVYLDPPFYTKRAHRHEVKVMTKAGEKRFFPAAYEDRWADFGTYLSSVAQVLQAAHEALAEDGVLALHVDFRSVGYFYVLLDHIFGPSQFVNEIIWQYKSGGASQKSFARKHDNVLIYSKGASYVFHPQKEKSYNREGKPYRFKGVNEYEDERGWYTWVGCRDVWEIPMVGRTSKERTGYPTQKPEALLKRLITAFTDEGDLVFDGYGGSGTTAAVAAKTGRRFITVDQSPLALAAMERRLASWRPRWIRPEPSPAVFVDRRAPMPVLRDVPVELKALGLTRREEEKLVNLVQQEPYAFLDRLSYEERGEWKEARLLTDGMLYDVPLQAPVVLYNVFGQRFVDQRKED